jgi:peptide/nickel transport system substrate-binding protein
MISIPRRPLLASLGALALGAGRSGAALAETPRNALVLGHLAELQTLDPAQAITISDFRILSNMYDGLARFKDGTLDVEPALATSWTISPDGKTYTFKLRDDVLFHDGSKFDAEAVKFNFDRVLDKNHPYYDTGPFPFVFVLGPIERTEVVDPTTVTFHLSDPYAPMLPMLASAIGSLAGVSPAAVKQYGKEFSRHGGGTGPYKFRLWEGNQRVVLEANAKCWRGAPKLAGMVFRPIVEDTSRVSEMLSGGTDLTIEVPPDNVPQFRQDKRFVYYEQPGPHLWYLVLNTRKKPFDDKRVRQALNYAINKQGMVDDLLKGTATVAASVTPPAFAWAYDETLAPYPYDPAKAKALLAEAGYPNGVDVVFYVTQNGSGMLSPVLMGSAIQADLAAAGIRAKIETYEWNTFLGKIGGGLGNADIAELSFMTQDPDMHPSLGLRTGAAVNDGGYSNPEVDRLIDAGRREVDPVKRAALYKQLQRVVHEDAPWGFVCHWKQNAVATASVKDYELMPSFSTRFEKTYKA